MVRRLWLVTVLCGVFVATAPSAAHHSIASQYDFEKELEMSGVLKRMDWINPHPVLHLEITKKDGTKSVWLFQTANSLLGTGSTSVLRKRPTEGGLGVGQTVTLWGFSARNGNPQAFLKVVKMPDGRMITAWFGEPT